MEPTAKVETITVEIAKALLLNNKLNRPVNKINLTSLTNEMLRNNFHLTGEAIKISINDDLLDGQHRLLAIIASGKPQELFVIRGLKPDSFKYMDAGKNRNAADILGIQKIKNPADYAAMAQFIIYFNRKNFAGTAGKQTGHAGRLTNSDINEFVVSNLKSMEDSHPYGYKKKTVFLSPKWMASLHYCLKQIDEKQAEEFCWKLSIGENLSAKSPIFVLRDLLLDNVRAKRKMAPVEKLALIFKAWNLFRENRKVTILKWSPKEGYPWPL